MVWGILEDKHMTHVPGTVPLTDSSDIPSEYRTIPQELLKHGHGRNAHIILAPQPSDSPNDPLNWPTWRKDVILTIVGLSAAVVGAYGPMLSPGFVVIAAELNVTVNILSQATAWVILLIGLSLFIFNPIAKKLGRRPVYAISSIIMLTGSVWGAVSKDYPTFLASRIYSGVGMAPYEVLVQCTIADMYFVHERATRIAIWNMFLLCGISGGALVAGYIIEGQGWKWTLIWCGIIFGALLPLVIFFVPETAYRRQSWEERLRAAGTNNSNEKSLDKKGEVEQEENVEVPETGTQPEKKDSFLRSLRFYTGTYTETPLWKIFLRPFVMFWYPAVLWAFLLYGVTLTWIVVFSVVNAVIFTAPPYNFSVSETGLISLSPFILSFIGEIISGPMNDWVCMWLAKKNRGIYEPEFRLPPIIISFLIGVAGFFGFGATVHYQTHWSGPVLTFGLANMSLAFSNASVFGYVIDAHKELSEEAFVAINARNLLTFGLTYFVNDWLARDGVLAVFNVLGAVFVGVNLLTIPLWIFGKRIRASIARNKTLDRFMHED
ncbi:major facilitator superfamily domain-containing protein [Xylaria bambusicola]|uniref:major facilitator superfamily domain-containing protein n=1 Tax=Xylaria bambusicola TaxID=326684 RepID=UPI0020088751|nr:major facilitator superfamily domain-containing protein [Xylaria bambusicola]KAI0521878.1 major facilitator superfamily domain-containing protein [Xylaria bambusicola]